MFSIKIVGPAGFGIKITGQILAKFFLRLGINVFAYTEYPSLIRGGHNTFQVDISGGSHSEERSDEESRGIFSAVNSPAEKCNILIALTQEALNKELNNLKDDAIIICDESITWDPDFRQDDKVVLHAPLIELAKNSGGEVMKNTVALGVVMALIEKVIPSEERNPLDIAHKIIDETFGHKGEIAEQNKNALKAGYEWVRKNNINLKNKLVKGLTLNQHAQGQDDNLLVSGNQACALGAIAAGCQVYVAYPMTPATEILHFLEAKQKTTNMVIHQGEDEIAVIHTALGASFAGVRAAIGTSGGGFALMTEGLSLAGQLELPLVIFEVMRPGPATGLPTWTEQGDLSFVLTAGHGDFPRAVLAPGNPEQCFVLTQKAFNLADRYQIPVFVLSDKFLGESASNLSESVFKKIEKIDRGRILKEIKGNYLRYKFEKNGVSYRTIPGVFNGEYICNSDEHNEVGFSNEANEVRKKMMDKRMQKLIELQKEIPLPKLYGDKNADLTLITWGSMLGPCLDALSRCHSRESGNLMDYKKDGIPVRVYPVQRYEAGMTISINVLHFSYLYPMPLGLGDYLKKFKRLVLVENNKTAQLGKLIRQETGIEIENKILKYDGRPIWKEEILRWLSS